MTPRGCSMSTRTSSPTFDVITNSEASGLANGRNQGLDAAIGEHIVFLDGDDWLAPNHLPTLMEAAHHLDVDFLRCDHTTVEGTAPSNAPRWQFAIERSIRASASFRSTNRRWLTIRMPGRACSTADSLTEESSSSPRT